MSKDEKMGEWAEGGIPIINRTILDAFGHYAPSQLTKTVRFEEEIFLADGLISSIDDLIVVAATLGLLLIPAGQVIVGITTGKSATYLEVDTTKLRDAGDVRTFITDLRQTTELSRHNVMVHVDIEVTDGKITPSEESPIWLFVQDGRCVLSVRGSCIEPDMFAHLCKVTAFA
jgi:hypothetical protein